MPSKAMYCKHLCLPTWELFFWSKSSTLRPWTGQAFLSGKRCQKVNAPGSNPQSTTDGNSVRNQPLADDGWRAPWSLRFRSFRGMFCTVSQSALAGWDSRDNWLENTPSHWLSFHHYLTFPTPFPLFLGWPLANSKLLALQSLSPKLFGGVGKLHTNIRIGHTRQHEFGVRQTWINIPSHLWLNNFNPLRWFLHL